MKLSSGVNTKRRAGFLQIRVLLNSHPPPPSSSHPRLFPHSFLSSLPSNPQRRFIKTPPSPLYLSFAPHLHIYSYLYFLLFWFLFFFPIIEYLRRISDNCIHPAFAGNVDCKHEVLVSCACSFHATWYLSGWHPQDASEKGASV